MNQSIWDVFGDGQCSVLLEEYDQEDMIEETNEEVDDDGTGETIPPVDEQKKNEIKRRPSKVIPLNGKDLENEFMRVFELVNDDFIFIEPKLIPMIPGDNPNVIHKVSDFVIISK